MFVLDMHPTAAQARRMRRHRQKHVLVCVMLPSVRIKHHVPGKLLVLFGSLELVEQVFRQHLRYFPLGLQENAPAGFLANKISACQYEWVRSRW